MKLLDDPKLIGEKVEEEAEEVVRAAREESDERVAEEAADLLYHLSVLLASREVPQSAVMEVLNGRRALSAGELRLEPSLERGARARRARATSSRSAPRFVDDCETPVSAFLKLRAGEPDGAPCFLLESAEQGQVGRYSFVGIRPALGAALERRRSTGARSRGGERRATPAPIPTPPSPSASPPTSPPRSRACRRSPAARSASSATTWSAPSSRSASRTPTRSACPTWR